MVKRIIFFLFPFLFIGSMAVCQSINESAVDSLKRAFLELNSEVETIQLNLDESKKKLKAGILVSTLGYTVTIIGGQLLGGPDNELGEVLLFAGGGIGIGGTYLIFDGFSAFNRKNRKRRKKISSP